MIDIKDLQIGNKVLYQNKVVEIETIHITGTIGIFNGSKDFIVSVSCKDIEPIEVTEELLLKLGFIFNEYDGKTYDNKIRVRKDKLYDTYGIYWECEDDWYSDIYPPYFKYLHELQNIFRMIKKIDLEVNL